MELSRHQKSLFNVGTLILLISYVKCMEPQAKSLTPSDLEEENPPEGMAGKSSLTSSGEEGNNSDTNPSLSVNPGVNISIQTVGKDLQNGLKALSADVDNLKTELTDLQTSMLQEVQRREDTINDVSQRMAQLEANRSNQPTPVVTHSATESPEPVAFSGSVNRLLDQAGDHDVIKFGSVLTTLGSPYNPLTGKFRCPVKGLYHFWMTIGTGPGEQLVTEILVNGIRQSLNHAGGREFGGMGSSILNLALNEGDTVWARNVNSNVAKTDLHWSNFNGYLIGRIA